MGYTAKSDVALQRALKRFSSASEELAMKGSYHPDCWEDVEEEFEKSKKLLEALIERSVSALERRLAVAQIDPDRF